MSKWLCEQVGERSIDELSEQESKHKNTAPEGLVLTPKQQQKQDALDLAELIYDIFKASLSNDTIEDVSRKAKQNV